MLYAICTAAGFLVGFAVGFLALYAQNKRAWNLASKIVEDAAEFWHAEGRAAIRREAIRDANRRNPLKPVG